MLTIKPKRFNFKLAVMLGSLFLAVTLALPVAAAEPGDDFLVLNEGQALLVQGPRQVFGDDLTVGAGEVIEDDVYVYSGDVEVIDGGRITGDLLVFSGNIEIDESSAVDGDVTTYSGNVTVAGHIGGDLANWSGNVELESTAQVDGDVSVVSGNIDRADGASVGGNVAKGPSFRFGAPFGDGPRARPGVSFEPPAPSFFSRILGFVGRLLSAALLTAFTMLLVGGLFYMRPQLIADTRRHLKEQLALSAVVGLLANLVLLFLAGLLAVTICLLPLALLPMLGLLALNVVGWAVASQIVGERIVSVSKQEVQPSLTILAGALVLTGVCALLWAMGGCFRPLAFLLVLAVSSLGTGAVMVPWINRRRGGEAGSAGGDDLPPRGPVGPVPSASAPVETDVAAPIDYVTAEEVNIAGERGSTAPSVAAFTNPPAEEVEMVEHELDAPIDHVTAEEVNATAEQQAAAKPSRTTKPRARGATKVSGETANSETGSADETVETDVAAPIDYVTAQEVITTEALDEGDDFLRIKGVGPVLARRLKDGGFLTFAQLAAASPDEVAAAIGWPVDRVRRAEVIDQAKMLARQS
ncbi:MAG: polymer-forming cytoskeletal protein [Caldilineaceae bacterium]|nr:polymer-forming cytoskeletal protein [Caldilineaceae bacterium]